MLKTSPIGEGLYVSEAEDEEVDDAEEDEDDGEGAAGDIVHSLSSPLGQQPGAPADYLPVLNNRKAVSYTHLTLPTNAEV